MRKLLAIVSGIISGIIQELSDQSAYRRYLSWHGVEHSGDAWRRFSDERWAARARRGRCC
jgi:hypothetical protein